MNRIIKRLIIKRRLVAAAVVLAGAAFAIALRMTAVGYKLRA